MFKFPTGVYIRHVGWKQNAVCFCCRHDYLIFVSLRALLGYSRAVNVSVSDRTVIAGTVGCTSLYNFYREQEHLNKAKNYIWIW